MVSSPIVDILAGPILSKAERLLLELTAVDKNSMDGSLSISMS
jgi:hypothetical protein